MLLGEYESSVGEKNRLMIPKKLRSELGESLILTRGYENCLILVDRARWNKLIESINKRPLLNLDTRDTKRFIVGGAQEIEPDNQGRFVLPETLKKFAGIEQNVVFLGIDEWIELWDLRKWQEKLNNLKDNVSDIADRITNNDS